MLSRRERKSISTEKGKTKEKFELKENLFVSQEEQNLFVSREEKSLCVWNIVLKKRISQKNEQTMHTMQPSSS